MVSERKKYLIELFLKKCTLQSFNKDYLRSPGNINTSRNSSASYSKALSQTYNAVLNYSLEIDGHINIDGSGDEKLIS